MTTNYLKALPEMIKKLRSSVYGKVIVIKCGGSLMNDPKFLKSFASDVATLHSVGARVVIVHGAGIKLNEMLEKFGIEENFLNGYRVTNKETMEIVEMVMSGYINKRFVQHLQEEGINTIGLSCKDNCLVTAKKIHRTQKDEGSNIERIIDLGFIGDPIEINEEFLENLLNNDSVTVVSPIAFDKNFNTLSLNADTLACFLGEKLEASDVVILSENYYIKSQLGRVSGSISVSEAEKMVYSSNIQHELLIRLKSATQAIRAGVNKVHIIDSQVTGSLLAEFTNNVTTGTVIVGE